MPADQILVGLYCPVSKVCGVNIAVVGIDWQSRLSDDQFLGGYSPVDDVFHRRRIDNAISGVNKELFIR